MTTKSTHQLLVEVIRWSAEAARDHVEMAVFQGETPDPDSDRGLWQAFQAKFPKYEGIAFPSSTAVDYDLLVITYSEVYSTTVKTLADFRPDGGRADFERTQEKAS